MARNHLFRSSVEMRRNCVVEIIEQPAPKAQRFRYASEVDESRSVGSIPGKHSTSERKTYPTIRVCGYKGPMVVMLSLVNPEDNLVHPHAITGNDLRYRCTNGVIYTFVDGPEVIFNNVGILCVKRKTEKDVTAALRVRQNLNIDPFKAGFPHIDDHSLINFDAVRLCFKVYIPKGEIQPQDRENLKKYDIDLKPVASTVVYDAKKLSELKIQYINKSVGSMLGGTELVILCEKYTGANPEVVFVEGEWEEKAQVTMYHKQMALVAITPPFRDPFCTRSVPVEVYLQRVGPRGMLERSAPASSEYIPVPPKSHPSEVGIKRPPPDYLEMKKRKRPFKDHLTRYIQSTDARGNDEVQRALAQLSQFLEPSPSIGSNYQDHASSMVASSQGNAPVHQDDLCWQQHFIFGTSNSFSPQVDSSVDYVAPNQFSDVNIATSSFNQYIDCAPTNMISYGDRSNPIMSDVTGYTPLVDNGPSTSYNANYNTMFAMPSEFFVAQEGANMTSVNTLPNPLPNIIPTTSQSSDQIPDVLLSPMSVECVSLNTDTEFNSTVVMDHFDNFDDDVVVNPQNMNNPAGFECDMQNISDELKKVILTFQQNPN